MKKFRFLVSLFLALSIMFVGLFVFTACGEEDEDDNSAVEDSVADTDQGDIDQGNDDSTSDSPSDDQQMEEGQADLQFLRLELKSDNTYEIVGYVNSPVTLKIPSQCEGIPITSVRERAFSECHSLTEVVFPDTITAIHEGAFVSCSNLSTFNIPKYLNKLGYCAFHYTAWYTNHSDGIMYAGNWAYYYKNIEKGATITLKDGTIGVGDGAFIYNSGIETLVVPNSVKHMGDYVFSNNEIIQNVVLPTGLTEITYKMFYHCKNLRTIEIPNSVTKINAEAFKESGLLFIDITDNVVTIGAEAFKNSKLYGIEIGESVREIETDAFSGCDRMVEVYNKSAINIVAGSEENSYIGYYAQNVFTPESGASKVDGFDSGYITFTDGGNVFLLGYIEDEPNAVIPNTITTIKKYAFSTLDNVESVTIPSSVKEIESQAFYSLKNLKSVTICDAPAARTNNATVDGMIIGSQAFAMSDALTNVSIGSSVVEIGQGAFAGCTSLVNVTFSENSQLRTIGAYAFQNTNSLTNIVLPEGLQELKERAFTGSALIQATVPVSIQKIETFAFDCIALSEIIYNDEYDVWKEIDKGSNAVPVWTIVKTSDYALITEVHPYLLFEQIDDNNYVVSGYYGEPKEVVIPTTYRKVPVTGIKDNAFKNCASIEMLTIGESIKTIGSYAFARCGSLKEVNMEAIDFMGMAMFYCCDALTSVTLSDSIKEIADSAFYECSSLKEIEFSENLESIGEWAFYACSELEKDIVIGDTIKTVDNYAFQSTGVKSVVITEGLELLGVSVFYGCELLDSVVISDNVVNNNTMINNNSFNGCSIEYASVPASLIAIVPKDSLKEVVVTSGEKIEDEAFRNCSTLSNVTMSESVVNIGYAAFIECTNLTDVKLSDLATNIGDYAFSGCVKLEKIDLPKELIDLGQYAFAGSGIVDLKIPEKLTYIRYCAFSNCDNLTSVIIPQTVTNIEEFAFGHCDNLKHLTINSDSTYIDIEAFYGDTIESANIHSSLIRSIPKTNLREVIITGGDSICDNAFYGSSSLKKVTLGNISSIGSYAFCSCSGLTNIVISNTITNISSYAFYDCTNLVEIYNLSELNITKGSDEYGFIGYYAQVIHTSLDEPSKVIIDNDGYIIYADGDTKILTGYLGENTELVLPNGITEISKTAFSGNSSITSVILPDSIISLGDDTFRNCWNLTSVTLPNQLESIGKQAFYHCDSLTRITIPNSVTQIGDEAFNLCYRLVEVYNLSSLNITKGSEENGYVGYYALDIYKTTASASKVYVDSNKYITYRSGSDIVLIGKFGMETSLTLPTNVTQINKNAFYDYDGNLINVEMSNQITDIGESAFRGCTSLTNITLSNQLISIGNFAFFCCYGLYTIEIPDSIMYVGKHAFDSCTNLQYIEKDNVKYLGNPTNPYLVAVEMIDKSATKLNIADGCKVIAAGAFAYIYSLTEVVIPNSVVGVGEDAFADCPIEYASVPTIVLPYILKTNLKELNVTGGEKVEFGALNGSSSLERITLPFVGENASATSSSYNQYPFGYIFGDTEYEGSLETRQKYYANNGTITRTSYYIPASLQSVTITGGNILYGAFSYCTNITSITITTPVTDIGDSAFLDCESLKSITMPDMVTTIGDSAFSGCHSLADVSIPNSLTSIGNSAFRDCRSITSINIPNGVTMIDGSAFYGCYKLVEVCNLSSLQIVAGDQANGYVGYYALRVHNETGATSNLTIDANGYMIFTEGENKYLVGYNGNDKELILPEGITEINKYAFSNRDDITSVTLPNSVTSIGSSAFYFCGSLTSVTIPNSVINIGESAFYYCRKLTSIIIPASVTSIGTSAFVGCKMLVEVYNLSSLQIIAGDTTNGNVGYYAIRVYDSLDEPSKVYVEDSYVIFADGEEKILVGYLGEETSLIIPNGITEIKKEAFRGNNVITQVVIPDTVVVIGEQAFCECIYLESLTIGSAVQRIDEMAFYFCGGISKVNYTGSIDSWCKIDFNGSVSVNPLEYGADFYLNWGFVQDLEIETGVTEIPAGRFNGCASLKSVTIKGTVENIGNYAFGNCTNLTKVVIGGSVKVVGKGAFNYCSALIYVLIGTEVESIGDNAFIGCYKLLEIYNLSTLTITTRDTSNGYVGYYAKNIYTEGSGESKLIYDPSGCIVYDTGSSKILVGYDGASTELIIPEEINEIYQYAFYHNDYITSVTIGSSISKIGKEAFAFCNNLKKVTINSSTIIIEDGAFEYSPIEYANMYTNLLSHIPQDKLKEVVIVGNGDIGIPLSESSKSLEKLTLSGTINSLSWSVFNDFINLSELVILSDIAEINYHSFYGCNNLKHVYYYGTVAEWNAIAFEGTNMVLNNATRYYYSETEPTEEGNYWHYVDGVVTVW